MTDLHDLLSRATDRIETPDLAATALRSARRRRTRRRGTFAAALASVVVAAVVVSTTLVSGRSADAPPAGPATSTGTAPSTPTPEVTAEAPPVDPALTQPMWDPERVTELAWGDSVLSRSLAPGQVSELRILDRTPVVAVVDTGSELELHHLSGRVSGRAYPEQPASPQATVVALSPDGTRLAFAGLTGVWVSVDRGEWRRLPYPAGVQTPTEFGLSLVVDAAGGVVVAQCCGSRSWYLDPDSGTATRLDGAPYDLTATPDGAMLGFVAQRGTSRAVVELRDGARVSQIDSTVLQSLNRPAASATSLVAMRGVGGYSPPREAVEQNGVLAVDRDTLATRAYLPIRDPNYSYTDGSAMGMLAWLDDDTALGYVITGGGLADGTRHLFSWNVETGDLRRVSELPASYRLAVAAAPGG